MLTITVPGMEYWDEQNSVFVTTQDQTLQLEHSLVSLSKWESKWHKSFLYTKEKTFEETLDYIKCMTITQDVDPEVYNHLTNKNVQDINQYIENPMTATTFNDEKSGKRNNEIITAEIIYYWMVSLNIPPEYQHWHLNRLIALIRVCNIKNAPPKKRSMRDIMAQNKALNDARRKQLGSKG